MKGKILILAGTVDGKNIARRLVAEGFPVLTTAAREYGASLLRAEGIPCRQGPLSEKELAALLREEEVAAVVDATHPYASEISRLAATVTAEQGIPLLRYRRPSTSLPESPLIHRAEGYEAAAHLACRLGKRVFLTTGSKHLPLFAAVAARAGCQVVARILPDPVSLDQALAAGIAPENIIAARGPFSREFNRAMFREMQAEVVVTKDSGLAGGTEEKVAAALELGIPVVVVDRPEEKWDGAFVAGSVEEVIAVLSEITARKEEE
ncbi:MAG: precorrin-6A/cobalt-precorrin-6A reductase [Eubacteriales bacterium]|nr:precorrin-6A/cobalt-precorrin-6A reductase [Eubacteriales bacterium]